LYHIFVRLNFLDLVLIIYKMTDVQKKQKQIIKPHKTRQIKKPQPPQQPQPQPQSQPQPQPPQSQPQPQPQPPQPQKQQIQQKHIIKPHKTRQIKKKQIEGQIPHNRKMYNFQPLNNRAINKKWNKVFCIGLNKTGTTSLHLAFQKMGLKSFHGGTFDYRIDAFSDGRYYQNYKDLDKLSPNSKFILNTRELRPWILSRIKHCQQPGKGHYTPGWEKDSRCDSDRIEEWVEQRWQLYREIKEYFKDRPTDLLVLDVCGGDNYQQICPFLDLSRIAEKFPTQNISSSKAVLTNEQESVIDELEQLEPFNNCFFIKK
jgi:hypothetical protein